MNSFTTGDAPWTRSYWEAIVAWSKTCDKLTIWDYFVNFHHFMAPLPNMHVREPHVRFYVDYNVVGIMMQGAHFSLGGVRSHAQLGDGSDAGGQPPLDSSCRRPGRQRRAT